MLDQIVMEFESANLMFYFSSHSMISDFKHINVVTN